MIVLLVHMLVFFYPCKYTAIADIQQEFPGSPVVLVQCVYVCPCVCRTVLSWPQDTLIVLAFAQHEGRAISLTVTSPSQGSPAWKILDPSLFTPSLLQY